MPPLRVSCCMYVRPTKIRKALGGCYTSTSMLPAALNLNVDWKTHMTNKELYGDTPQITTKIKARRLTFAGHCKRAEGCIMSKLVTWQPTQGTRSKGCPKKTYVDLLEDDTGYAVNIKPSSMPDSKNRRSK